MKSFGLFCLFLIKLTSQPVVAQEWLWGEDKTVLNPNGLDIRSNNVQFQILDWDDDGLYDFIINDETGTLQYYEQVSGSKPLWINKTLALPEIGFIYGWPTIPKNFIFFDWDEDGDHDLAADESRFWWNTGSDASPVWVNDDSLLAGIYPGFNTFFFDYNHDGDWDAFVDDGIYYATYLHLNEGDNSEPKWVRQNTEDYSHWGLVKLINLNSDTLVDLTSIEPIPADPGTHLQISLYRNTGMDFVPFDDSYENYWSLVWSTFGSMMPVPYQPIDFNGDTLIDFVKSDWQRHIVVHNNRGTLDSLSFHYEPDEVLGPVNVESGARPFFFDIDQNGLSDLLVSGNFLTDFGFDFFHEGRIYAFINEAGRFDPGVMVQENIPQSFYRLSYPNLKNNLTLDFADGDEDDDIDYLAGFLAANLQDEIIGSGILYFQNIGTETEPEWQADSTRFTYFLQPDSLFYDPHLLDIDRDGDLDLFLQRDGSYTFYERIDGSTEIWRENRGWLSGLESLQHHSAVFVDLTEDSKEDIVFGETDGTLTLYERTGSVMNPTWLRVDSAFAGIDVGKSAAPAFADLNKDSRLDMIVGNDAGLLFCFHNESVVYVAAGGTQPETFQLHQNFPNPFNPETTIKYELSKTAHAKLYIYNVLGIRVRTLFDELKPAGSFKVKWDGKDEAGVELPSGVYFYELKLSRGAVGHKKMLLLR